MTAPVTGIVLAAGASSRMGRPKALLPYAGVTFLDAVLAKLRTGGVDDCLVVLGSQSAEIQAGTDLVKTRVVVNDDWRRGQFSSVRKGLESVAPGSAAAVVALVDLPHVPVEVIRNLIDEYHASRAPVVRPVWRGRGGHPLLFASETFSEFLALPADATTYDVVKKFRERRRDVLSPDDSVVDDMDTPEDYARLMNRLKKT